MLIILRKSTLDGGTVEIREYSDRPLWEVIKRDAEGNDVRSHVARSKMDAERKFELWIDKYGEA